MNLVRLVQAVVDMRKKLIAEFIGTFFLIIAGCGAIVVNQQTGALGHSGVALTWGAIVMVLIYGVGDVSGAHMNPAVTISFAIANRFSWKEVFPYIMIQTVAAIAASYVLVLLFPGEHLVGSTVPSGTWYQSFVLEFLLTFLLMYIILHVSSGSKEKGIMAGMAIGTTVGLEAMFAGPITGASMNPARSLGPALVSGRIDDVWIYIFATTIGAITAVMVNKFTK